MSDQIRGSVISDLIDALLPACVAGLPDVNVSDSFPEVLNSGDYLAIGVDDWDLDKPADSGNSTMDWANSTSGHETDETGSITCVCWSQAGGTGQAPAVRRRVFAIMAAVKTLLIAALEAAPTDALGVPGLWDVKVGGADGFNQASNANGASAVLRFSIPFRARI